MKKLLLSLLVGILILSCGKPVTETNTGNQEKKEKEVIVTSIPTLKWIVEKIAGDEFEVKSVIQPNTNHELFEPKPEDLKVVENSKVFFSYDMLPFEKTISEAFSSSNKVVNVLNGVDQTLFIKGHHHHHHDGDEDHDHDHDKDHEHDKDHDKDHDHEEEGGLDPHVWFSIEMMPKVTENIKNELVKAYPEKKDIFEKNYNEFLNEIKTFKAEIDSEMAKKTKEYFIIYHPALEYFLRDYKVKEISIEYEGKEPSAKQLKEIIEEAKEHGITTILVQPQFPKQSADILSTEIPNSKIVEFNVDKENVFENLKFFVSNLD